MNESWETKAGGYLGSPSQRDNLFDYLKKKKKKGRPRLGAPYFHPEIRPKPCLEAKGRLLLSHCIQGGPVRGQSVTLHDTLTLLNNSGVFFITKGFKLPLCLFGNPPTPAIGTVEIGVNICNLTQ